jgi:hypothetical protein
VTRPLTDRQRAVWSKPINPGKSDTAPERTSRAEKVSMTLRESIEASVQKRIGKMKRVKE